MSNTDKIESIPDNYIPGVLETTRLTKKELFEKMVVISKELDTIDDSDDLRFVISCIVDAYKGSTWELVDITKWKDCREGTE